MKIVTKLHISTTETLEIIQELRQQGYRQGADFDFACHQAKYNNDGWSAVEPRKTEFIFYNDTLATWFSLKFQ